MSDSRLEKFIYAICSMDVSDLPVPLSRIEKLWNCLITGETPDFEPLSRNEKYLMAMLDRYDISNLPAPMSRGEKLLYKIAVGETDLSDVPGYLSRYEELLKYLIENGGISGGDFEYVLYTLNQSLYTLYTTAEKPVKSAILKGQTLVNMVETTPISKHPTYTDFELTFVDKTKYYFIKFECSMIVNEIGFIVSNSVWNIKKMVNTETGYVKLKPDETKDITALRIRTNDNTESTIPTIKILCVEYQEGMENWDIPYFTGMQSVKMPVLKTRGKNLFDGIMTSGQLLDNNVTNNNQTKMGYSEFSPVEEKTDICCSYYTNSNYKIEKIFFYDENKTQIGSVTTPQKVTTPKGTKYFRFSITTTNWSSSVVFNDIKDDFKIQVETGTQTTPYEPYKSNTLTTPEDLELRGIGNVKDEMNCLTGEVIERTSEAVIDGNESWVLRKTNENTLVFNVEDLGLNSFTDFQNSNTKMISDKFVTGWYENNDKEFICGKANGQGLLIGILKSKLATQDVDGIKQWLSQNPVTIQYQLATESIKTVDLTVVDQDGNVTTLETFDDTTHVLLNSEGLIPTAALTVRTKIPSASSTSPLMDDISTKQEQLNTTVDEQSNNVDATMIATTEIYEETL